MSKTDMIQANRIYLIFNLVHFLVDSSDLLFVNGVIIITVNINLQIGPS